MLSSGESRFDYGLITILKTLFNEALLIEIEKKEHIVKPAMVRKYVKVCNEEVTDIDILKLPYVNSVSSLHQVLSNLINEEKLGLVVVPRNPQFFSLGLALGKHYDAKIVWNYSPTPFYLLKALELKSMRKISNLLKLKELMKGLSGFSFNVIQGLFSDKAIFMNPVDYKIFSKFLGRKAILIPPPYASLETDDSYHLTLSRPFTFHLDEALLEDGGYILSVITIARTGIGKIFEELSLHTILWLSKKCKNMRFLVVGTSSDHVKRLGIRPGKFPNVSFLGFITCDKLYKSIIEKAAAILIPQFIPGRSNRVIEAIYYEKPFVTTPLAQRYHIGLRHRYNSLICNSGHCFIKALKEIIHGNLYDKIKNGLRVLRATYYNYPNIKKILQDTLINGLLEIKQ